MSCNRYLISNQIHKYVITYLCIYVSMNRLYYCMLLEYN